MAFQTHRRFWEEDQAIYGGIAWTDQDIRQIWYPSYGYHRNKGILIGSYTWGQAGSRFTHMRPSERLQAAMTEGTHVHPQYATEIESGVSWAWQKAPFQKGGWPIKNHGAIKTLQNPDGAIYFAGDQVTALPGWQEGAALSAHAAVHGIQKRVHTDL